MDHAPQGTSAVAGRWWILAVIGLAQLMVVLDGSIVNIALPSAQRALDFSDADRQWIVTAYALAFGSLLLLGGRVSDLVGRRATLMVGLVGFAVASAVGGASVDFTMLVVARATQGAFGALLAPSALALLTTTFPDGGDRGKAFGVFGAIAGAGSAIGLVLGGVLTEFLSWRWCLYVNLVFAAAALVGAATLLPRQPRLSPPPRLDLTGAATVSAALFCVVFGFSSAETHPWSSPWVWGLLVAGVALIGVFAVMQARGSHPLLPPRVVLDRDRAGAYLAVLLVGVGIFGLFLFLSFYLQQILHFAPLLTGLAFLPTIVTIVAASTTSTAVLLPRLGPRLLVAVGMTGSAGGLFWLSFLQTDSTYAADVLPALLLTGVGLGLALPAAITTATRGVLPADAGVASAMVNTMQQVGGSVGTALLTSIAATASAGYLRGATPAPDLVARAAVHSYTTAFAVGASIFLVGAAVCAAILRPRRHAPIPGAPPAERPLDAAPSLHALGTTPMPHALLTSPAHHEAPPARPPTPVAAGTSR